LPRDATVSRWYATGPHRDLLGRRVASLPVGPESELGPGQVETGSTIEVAEGEDFPALVVGRVNGTAPDGTSVAITVDGRVAAVVPLYTDQFAPGRVAAMLLRSTLTEGTHQIRFYEVAGGDPSTLRPIPLG
ncbi:MAG TPA: hypothetical protein PKA98_13360, partial [Acidimicrobiales bacterium]|nr:hypothetical protein [Acidimicrobiales bacterium]